MLTWNSGILQIAGPEEINGEEQYRMKINRLLNNKKGRIVRLGKVDNVSKFLSNCDCLVLPSAGKLESFGMVQVEAMMNGTPCVTSNLPGLRVPIQVAGMGELFKPNNAKDLADKIRLVLRREKIYYQQKVKNLEWFDYKKTVDE